MVEQIEAQVKEILTFFAPNVMILLTQADACGIVMLAPKVCTAPSYSSAGSYAYVVAS